ncbi:hypothetical protein NX722_12210 [Endozoicomonas gorgoniicola]|uniref:Nicastrin n=1 Tax=Endozoicomonas gorgoniicola TaxID=1234144 RepID=A0ABT3MVI3_9GAMM|nr:hypothetical protein [Endozoicomonas gorgoniicola]MCW7553382.1 hypothetical protein [Endozoicomonas gorgoniicola]
MGRSLLFLTLGFLLTVSHKTAASGSCGLSGLSVLCNAQYRQPPVLKVLIHESTLSTRIPVVLYHDEAQNAIIATELSAYPTVLKNSSGVTTYGLFSCFGSCVRPASDEHQSDSRKESNLVTSVPARTSGNSGSGEGGEDKPPFSDYEKKITDDDPQAGEKRKYVALIRKLLHVASKFPVIVSKTLTEYDFIPNTALISWADSLALATPTGPRSFSFIEAEECDYYDWMKVLSALSNYHQEDKFFDPLLFINFFMHNDSDNRLSLIIQSIDTCSVITEQPDKTVNHSQGDPAHDNTPGKIHPAPAGQTDQ